jgi:hypothetical protein
MGCRALTPPGITPTLSEMEHGARKMPAKLLEEVHRLVEENRLQCLWFMREDYLPFSVTEADRALAEIELHGDRRAWAEARRIRAWLSQNISAPS